MDEKFLEDINNILNIGEVPNLYPPDDKEGLIAEVKEGAEKERHGQQLTPLQLWETFVSKCKMNLHLILNLSPVGEKLR